MRKRLIWGALLLLCLAALWGAAAQAEQGQAARNIIKECQVSSPSGKHFGWLSDGRARYGFESAKGKNSYLQITAKEPIHGLYFQWKEPCEWVLQSRVDGQWTELSRHGQSGMAQEYVPVEGLTELRVVRQGDRQGTLAIAELQVLSAGELPPGVHNWQPAHEKADLLVLSAHPDDEWIFMGGTIPYYAVERGAKVTVAYLTYADSTRRQELLDGLWVGGLRNYPELGDFDDQYRSTLKGIYLLWGEDKCKAFVTGVMRKYRPEVVVTHDLEGEYGHGAHCAAADSALFAFDAAADAAYTQAPGAPWQVKKLYLHLWAENQLRMDWKTPMELFGGKTPLEVAREGYACHVTQRGGRHDFQKKTFWFKVYDGGVLDNALFGLSRSVVGLDEAKNDFLENIPWEDRR